MLGPLSSLSALPSGVQQRALRASGASGHVRDDVQFPVSEILLENTHMEMHHHFSRIILNIPLNEESEKKSPGI